MSTILILGSHEILTDSNLSPQLVVAAVENPIAASEASGNTVHVDFSDRECRLSFWGIQGVEQRAAVKLNALFELRRLNADLQNALAERMGRNAACVPLFLLVKESAVGIWRTYSQIWYDEDNIVFTRTGTVDLAADFSLSNVERVIANHRNWFLRLNNERCFYTKCHDPEEIEIKLNLSSNVDIWDLSIQTYNAVRARNLPGYRLELKAGYWKWDYVSHLFEVTAPAEDVGYISIIPTVDGKNIIKRKWFKVDSIRRKETLQNGVEISGVYSKFIAERFDVTVRQLPSFRRVRYDVNTECLASGNVISILFDRTLLLDRPETSMYQCEIEYSRSRMPPEPDPESVFVDLRYVTEWVKHTILEPKGIRYREGAYSKLTFLREVIAGSEGWIP